MGMAAPVYYSAEMVRNIPDDGKRYETVHGELFVTPAPRALHQRIVLRMARVLADYVEKHGGGEVFISPADISWSPDTLVQPDVFVVDPAEARTSEWSKMKNLLLVAEVMSPGTTRQDRFAKRRLYQEVGVPLYWIVDPDQKAVEVWTPEAQFPSIERERLVWTQESVAEACVVDLEELFNYPHHCHPGWDSLIPRS
jgi:Uma2 family endonuclease